MACDHAITKIALFGLSLEMPWYVSYNCDKILSSKKVIQGLREEGNPYI